MAANTTGRQTYTFRDCKGQVGRMAFLIHYNNAEAAPEAASVASNMATALVAASNGALISMAGPLAQIFPSSYGARADYADAEDKAVLVYQDVGGALHRFSVPAPKAALFMTDAQTVSPTSGLLVAITNALITAVGDASFASRGGQNFTAPPAGFVGGFRSRRRTQRKMTIWTLSGGLDEPAE